MSRNMHMRFCAVVVLLSAQGFCRSASSLDQPVSKEHPDSAPTCLAFVFKMWRIENDTQRMLEEYDRVKASGVKDKIKFLGDYLNRKRELRAVTAQLSPVAFKELKKYAILVVRPDASANPHFAVFCGWRKGLFLLFEPDAPLYQGIKTTEQFLEQYQGTAVVISRNAASNNGNQGKEN